jgi:hypothetical protein
MTACGTEQRVGDAPTGRRSRQPARRPRRVEFSLTEGSSRNSALPQRGLGSPEAHTRQKRRCQWPGA